MKVEVRSRVPGPGDGPLPAVLVELAEESTTIRDLIRRAVVEQIAVTRADAARCRALLDRQYLTPDDIRTMAARGAITGPTGSAGRVEPPDVDTEVARALKAFERRVFVVFCGGRQVETLDEPVTLRLGEPVVFLRLVPLAGG